MSGRIIALLLVGVLLFCLLAGVALIPYNMGWGGGYGPYYAPVPAPAPVQPAPAPAPYPYPYYYPPMRPFGWGLFGFLGPLFGIILIVMLVRLFCRPWRWHHYSHQWAGGVPPGFEEMHRRAHESGAQPPPQPNPPAADR